jgi:hypothetical protein
MFNSAIMKEDRKVGEIENIDNIFNIKILPSSINIVKDNNLLSTNIVKDTLFDNKKGTERWIILMIKKKILIIM